MSTRDASLIFELGFVLAIYAAFILPYLLFKGVFNTVFLQYIAISTLTSATVLLLYAAYTKKQVMTFVLVFTIIGVLLFSMSTIITQSYITTETYPSTYSSNWGNNTVTLGPLESENISIIQYPAYMFPLNANGTQLQFTFSNNGSVRFMLYYTGEEDEQLALNESFGSGGWPIGFNWFNIYWTPIGPIDEFDSQPISREGYYHQISVGLQNLENSPEQVNLNITYFDFTNTAQQNITNYHPVIDYRYGYLGMGLIIAAMTIELGTWKRRPYNKQSATAST